MPVKVMRKGGKFRVVESESEKVARNAAGTPVDGTGHSSRAAAQRQATAINLSEARKHGADVPPRRRGRR